MDKKVIALIFISVGIIILLYAGFNYVTTETLLDIGPLKVETQKNNFVKISPIIGALFLIAGVFILLLKRK